MRHADRSDIRYSTNRVPTYEEALELLNEYAGAVEDLHQRLLLVVEHRRDKQPWWCDESIEAVPFTPENFDDIEAVMRRTDVYCLPPYLWTEAEWVVHPDPPEGEP